MDPGSSPRGKSCALAARLSHSASLWNSVSSAIKRGDVATCPPALLGGQSADNSWWEVLWQCSVQGAPRPDGDSDVGPRGGVCEGLGAFVGRGLTGGGQRRQRTKGWQGHGGDFLGHWM